MKAEIDKELVLLKSLLNESNPNVQILALFKERKHEHDKKLGTLRQLQASSKEIETEHNSLKDRRHKQFREGFKVIASHLQ
jgi:chromosome segregation ATPase